MFTEMTSYGRMSMDIREIFDFSALSANAPRETKLDAVIKRTVNGTGSELKRAIGMIIDGDLDRAKLVLHNLNCNLIDIRDKI